MVLLFKFNNTSCLVILNTGVSAAKCIPRYVGISDANRMLIVKSNFCEFQIDRRLIHI